MFEVMHRLKMMLNARPSQYHVRLGHRSRGIDASVICKLWAQLSVIPSRTDFAFTVQLNFHPSPVSLGNNLNPRNSVLSFYKFRRHIAIFLSFKWNITYLTKQEFFHELCYQSNDELIDFFFFFFSRIEKLARLNSTYYKRVPRKGLILKWKIQDRVFHPDEARLGRHGVIGCFAWNAEPF